MATLSKTSGATIVVSTSTVQYVGNDLNQFFGGSGDRIAMLAFGAPAALGTDEQVSAATLKVLLKADTQADSDNVTLGLITSAWSGGDNGFPGMYAACSGPTVTAIVSTGLTEAAFSIPVAALLQAWASNPSAYSGIYLRCPALSLARVSKSGAEIDYSTVTVGYPSPPTHVSLSALLTEQPPIFSWSGATGGTNNPISGYSIGYADSTNGVNYGSWSYLPVYTTSESSGSVEIPNPTVRGTWRKVCICTNTEQYYSSAWVEAGPFRYNSIPGVVSFDYPAADDRFHYNLFPRFLITMPAEADDHLMRLEDENGEEIPASSPGPHPQGKQLVIRAAVTGQPVTVKARARDELGVAGQLSQREAPRLDPDQITNVTEFEPGNTMVMATHINDLRQAINYLRGVYGVPFDSWIGGAIVAGTTPTTGWADHIEEMREKLDAIITKINTWDSTATEMTVPEPDWIEITGTQPRADVMQQLLDVIKSI